MCIRDRSGRAARSSRAAPAASVTLLADEHGSQVVVAVRRHPAQRRWRRLTVLIDAGGVIEECLYDDDVPAVELGALDAAPLARGLLLEGYRAVSAELAAVRALVAAAAQRAAVVPQRLSSAYYLGRDLLDLGDLHLGPRAGGGALETAIGRAVDLFALGDVTRARELASACGQMAPDNADVASTLGLCLLAAGELSAATEWLTRAAAAEPNWPMHHWNLAAAHHRADRPEACAQALAEFLAANERADAVLHDDTHAERLALARRYLASHPPLAPARPRTRKPRRPRRLAADPARTRRD